MARVLQVSASGAWRSRPPSARATSDQDLLRRIRTIHAASRGTCGAPRVRAELQAKGVAIAKKRVARLMQVAQITGVSRRRSIRTTRSNPADRPASDLVRRNFFVAAPNRLRVADIIFYQVSMRKTHRDVVSARNLPSCSAPPKRARGLCPRPQSCQYGML